MLELMQQLSKKYKESLQVLKDHELYLYVDEYRGKIKRKVFFNFSNLIPNNNNEIGLYLESFHEEFIAPYYYKDSGSIQWNYYVVFVVDTHIDENIVAKIEKNKDYTRKIVLQKNKFNDFLHKESFIEEFYSNEVDLAPNLLSKWDEQLTNNKLKFICDGTAKNKWIEKLLEVDTMENIEIIALNNEVELDTNFPENTFIKGIQLNGYRPFPKERGFTFGKVNLIHGVNGTGKTSLLEAIEIVTCGGKTKRNYGESENTDISKLVLNFSSEDISTSLDNSINKNRDKEWYSSTNDKGNKLFENFNRFNFYHADAANEISNDGNINEIIKGIILGKDIAKYEKKISESKDEFKRELGRIDNKYIPTLTKDISSLSTQIESINSSKKDLEIVHEKFKETIELVNWKRVFHDYEKIQDVFFEIEEVKKIFNDIYNISKELNQTDISNIDEKEKKLIDNKRILQNSIKNIIDEKRKKEEFLKKVSNLSSRISNLEKLAQWIQIDNISNLLGLDQKLIENQKELNFLENIFKNKELNPSFTAYMNYEDNLVEFENKLKKDVEEQKSELVKFKAQLESKEKEVGLLSSYKTNLQDFTRKIINLTGIKEKCPVCETDFKEDELNILIEHITNDIQGIKDIKDLRSAIEFLGKEINTKSNNLDVIEEINSLVQKIQINALANNISIKNSIEQIAKSYEKMVVLKEEKKNLEELKNYFNSKGLTEIEYSHFIKNYQENYLNKYGKLSEQSLTKIRNEYILEITTQEKTIESFEKEINLHAEVINKVKNENKIFIEGYQELDEYFSKLLAKVQLIRKYLEILFKYFVPNSLDIEEIKKQIDNLDIVSLKYSHVLIQNEKNSSIELQLKKEFKDKSLELDNNNGNKTKIENALIILDRLELSEDQLQDFFNKNTKSILDVFITIHAPKEFNDLSFIGKEIKLKRSITNTWEGINRISTGQKNALALAIFLVMNKNATKAPKYILFDDPVSNTDDINILAFFDFLRDISLSNQRQIFFATANSKVANLFRKKFDFLGEGEDFQYHPLER